MSSFVCDKCGAICTDTPRGYVTGCKHYPIKPAQPKKPINPPNIPKNRQE